MILARRSTRLLVLLLLQVSSLFVFLSSWNNCVVVVDGAEDVATTKNKRIGQCQAEDIKRGKDLKNLILNKHVLVSLQEKTTLDDDDDDSDDDNQEIDSIDNDEYKELCDRFQNTPYERIKDLEIVTVKESPLRKKVLSKATKSFIVMNNKYKQQHHQSKKKPKNFWDFIFYQLDWIANKIGLGSGSSSSSNDKATEPNYPEYVLFTKGNFGSAVRLQVDHGEDEHGVTVDEEGFPLLQEQKATTADDITEFVSRQLRRKKLGSYVYSLQTFDLIVSQFMKAFRAHNSNGSSRTGVSRDLIKAYAWAYTAYGVMLLEKYNPERLRKMMTNNNNDMDDYTGIAKLSKLYVKTIFKILHQDDVDYPEKQIERLAKILQPSSGEDDGDDAVAQNHNLSDLKKEELHQKAYTLKKYLEPDLNNIEETSITEERVNNFVKYLVINFGFMCMVVILLPLMYLFLGDDNGDSYDDQDDYDDDDYVDKNHDDDDDDDDVNEYCDNDDDDDDDDDDGKEESKVNQKKEILFPAPEASSDDDNDDDYVNIDDHSDDHEDDDHDAQEKQEELKNLLEEEEETKTKNQE